MAKLKEKFHSLDLVKAAKGSLADAAAHPGGPEKYWDEQLEKMVQLIAAGADPNSRWDTNFGGDALRWAADRGNLKILRYLLGLPNINVNQRDGEGKMLNQDRTPVMTAIVVASNIRTPKDERYQVAIELINDERTDCDVFDTHNDRANVAFDTKNMHMVAILIKAGAKDSKIQPVLESLLKRYPRFIDLPTVILGEKKTALELAKECGNEHAVNLIEKLAMQSLYDATNKGIGRSNYEKLLEAISQRDDKAALELIKDSKTECDIFDNNPSRELFGGVQGMHVVAILIKASRINPSFHGVLEALITRYAGFVELPTVMLGKKQTALEYARELGNAKAVELIEATMKQEIADAAFHHVDRRNYGSLFQLLSKHKQFVALKDVKKTTSTGAIGLEAYASSFDDYRSLGCVRQATDNVAIPTDKMGSLINSVEAWGEVMVALPALLSEPEPVKPQDPILLEQIRFLANAKEYGRLLQKLQGAHGHGYLIKDPATAYRTLSTSDWGALAKQYAEAQDECALGCVLKAANRPEVQEAVLAATKFASAEFVEKAKASMANVK